MCVCCRSFFVCKWYERTENCHQKWIAAVWDAIALNFQINCRLLSNHISIHRSFSFVFHSNFIPNWIFCYPLEVGKCIFMKKIAFAFCFIRWCQICQFLLQILVFFVLTTFYSMWRFCKRQRQQMEIKMETECKCSKNVCMYVCMYNACFGVESHAQAMVYLCV